MKVGTARAITAEWVMKHLSEEPWFRGAYFSGSTILLNEKEELPAASDLDVVVVMSHDETPLKLGKFRYEGVLIEITYLSWSQLQSVEEVLTDYHLAGSFRVNTIISDPTGHLEKLYHYISAHFTDETWVIRRCEHARLRIENGLKAINPRDPWHDQVTSWLFPTGVNTHVILVAALQNPTVRLRYLKVRDVLMDYGYDEVYSELLRLLGVCELTAERTEHHLQALEQTFDAAVSLAKTPFFFSSDITAEARPIVIDGSRELIRSGFHREAVFWMVATFARCHKIFDVDGNEDIQSKHRPAFEAMVADLGIVSTEDLTRRAKDGLQYLPKLWKVAESIVVANQQVKNKSLI
ncbi:hypothetical protein [Fictibacillus phosphorivorans]|uniref:hypothetical protein n=1 Tax=Fictibacillus phosphorivorans TaxID=1221500 RepID=UPI00203F61D6|nr:hypothetical protein [Fictibacillus phosphorivorans]MCM3718341.1 hypothetical protein [Fictibacillus phosphorivorans]MCM3775965.1 hypothetical protein [Fictibacillus phosphorivorans]